MKLYFVGRIMICGLLAATLALLVAFSTHQGTGRIYSVDAARATLMNSPQSWVGRSLYVQGRLDGCPSKPATCPIWQARLFEPARASGSGALPVDRTSSEQWLSTLHQIPVLGALIPAPRPATWGATAVYQLRVRAQRLSRCLTYLCEPGTSFDAFSCDAMACYSAVVAL